MAGVNKVFLLGHLGKDPELKTSQSGTSVCRFSLATSEKYNGEEKTEWHSCVAFGKTAEIIDEYLRKGSQAFFEGRIQTRKWQDKSGNDRYTTEIIVNFLQMLGGKSDKTGSESRRSDDRGARHNRPGQKDDDPFKDDFGPPPTEDDMPF